MNLPECSCKWLTMPDKCKGSVINYVYTDYCYVLVDSKHHCNYTNTCCFDYNHKAKT